MHCIRSVFSIHERQWQSTQCGWWGGGFHLLGDGVGTGLNVQFNYFHGVQSDAELRLLRRRTDLRRWNGTTQGHSVWTNLTINWNTFGPRATARMLMNTFFYPSSQTGNNGYNYNNNGGYCERSDLHTSTTNLTVEVQQNRLPVEEGSSSWNQDPNGGQTGKSVG